MRFRLILMIMLAGVIPCLVILFAAAQIYESQAVNYRTADIQNQCTILNRQLSESGYLENVFSAEVDAAIAQLSSVYNGRLVMINSDLKVVRDTYNLDGGKTDVSEHVVRCISGETLNHYDRENRFIEVASPVKNSESGEVIGVILASVSADSIAATKEIILAKGAMIVGILSILICVLAVFVSERMVRPLQRITAAIGSVSEGYADDVLHEDTFTETKLLSQAFNRMLGHLKLLDESRDEFVSNVSHELKTPMTSMKVLADSLLEMGDAPAEMYREFLGDIAKEIDRENQIITDLLSLVKMDKSAHNMHVESVNINALLEQILKRLKPIAEKNGIEIVMESFRPVTAEIDETKFTLAISNLVENAIKYNQKDGWVHVSLNADHKFLYIKVEDSGIGIPEQDQDHIFERFYRVDKSHSREIGGTGLGLAIARNAVIVHRGAIKVHSVEGEGTTFTVRVPLSYVPA